MGGRFVHTKIITSQNSSCYKSFLPESAQAGVWDARTRLPRSRRFTRSDRLFERDRAHRALRARPQASRRELVDRIAAGGDLRGKPRVQAAVDRLFAARPARV